MSGNQIRRLLKVQIAALFILGSSLSSAQNVSTTLLCDVGTNQVAKGLYAAPSALLHYSRSNYSATVGMQMTFSGADRNLISGWQAAVARDFRIKDFPLSVSLFTVINPYSDLMHEVNIGVLAGHERDHLMVQLGNATRVYGLNKEEFTLISAEPDPSLRIIEYRNLTYQVVGYLKKMDSEWNVGAGVTNMDHFRVQQETNPMFMVTAFAEVVTGLSLNAEFWLQGAGMTNLSAENYGYYGRIGLTWIPGSDK